MSHDCLFCRISREEIPAHVIHQDSRLLAFLDIHPVRPGHVLIIPASTTRISRTCLPISPGIS